MADRVPCVGCSREILATTAARNDGHCKRCRPTAAASRARTTASRDRLAAGWSTSTGIGVMIFVFFCGIPALELNGFGGGLPFTFSTAILSSAIGGIVGGALICPRPLLAGAIGGAVAGPLGLITVYYYTSFRASVWDIELVLVQGIASLPGVGVGLLIKRLFAFLDTSGVE